VLAGQRDYEVSGLLGFSVGWAIKEIMKLAFIGLGLLVLLIRLLEYQRWITINWSIVENQTSVLMTHAANKIATITQHMNHEIPVGMGLLGFAPGVLLGFFKG